MIKLKVTKTQGFALSLEDTFLKKNHREEGVKLIFSPPPSPSLFRVKIHSISGLEMGIEQSQSSAKRRNLSTYASSIQIGEGGVWVL